MTYLYNRLTQEQIPAPSAILINSLTRQGWELLFQDEIEAIAYDPQ